MTFPMGGLAVCVVVSAAELDWNVVADIPCLARVDESFAKVTAIVFAFEQIKASLRRQTTAFRFLAAKICGAMDKLGGVGAVSDVAPHLSFANPKNQAWMDLKFIPEGLTRCWRAENFPDLLLS